MREYIFLDASFQSWADGVYDAIKGQTPQPQLTMVVTNKGIADPYAGRDPWCLELEAAPELWATHQAWCEEDPKRATKKPKRLAFTCEELEAQAREWLDYEDWCREMKDDMRNVDKVDVVRTKVFHGNQPEHFSGGLELPEELR